MRIRIPYGKTWRLADIPARRLAGVVRAEAPEEKTLPDGKEAVEQALARPIASLPLRELARGKKRVVILCSDHTRPVPSRVLLPPMLREIRLGNPQADVTLLVATGCHRGSTGEELKAKFGEEIYSTEKIAVHDCENERELADLGVLPSGGRLLVNRLAAEADLLAAEGFIEPHFFAGFSGGRKSVLPGIAGRSCVHYNHNSAFMDSPFARTGVLDQNPVHRDMLYAAQKTGLSFIVNAVLDGKGRIRAVFAGDTDQAHREGAAFAAQGMTFETIPAPIVITSNNGYPLDQNVYQMVKSISTAAQTCLPGGVIIAVGACSDGVGGDAFYRMLRDAQSPSALLEAFRKTPPEETKTDQWQAHILARALENHRVILVSSMDPSRVRDMKLLPAQSIAGALRLAEDLLGDPFAPVTVVPEGISVIFKDTSAVKGTD